MELIDSYTMTPVGSNITVTCIPGYYFSSSGNTMRNFTCESLWGSDCAVGWHINEDCVQRDEDNCKLWNYIYITLY